MRILPSTEVLEFAEDLEPELRAYLGYEQVADALFDPRGRTVRFTPRRRTVLHDVPSFGRLFCKFRQGRSRAALAEWRNLAELRRLGIPVPRRLFRARDGSATVIGIAAVPGRPMDALLREGREVRRALREMPELVRRLHVAGWVYRDLYWNHVFAAAGDSGLSLVDVERAFRPRAGMRRWMVKDFAGLLASLPSDAPVSRADRLRFLRTATGSDAVSRHLVTDVVAKARRIRAHTTRYPG